MKKISKLFFAGLFLSLVFLFCFATANAMTQSERQALIVQIRQQIADLQAQILQMVAQQSASSGDTFPLLGYANTGSSWVAKLHRVLDDQGISYGADGSTTYSTGTAKAVAELQGRFGIPKTGYVGKLTRSILDYLSQSSQVAQGNQNLPVQSPVVAHPPAPVSIPAVAPAPDTSVVQNSVTPPVTAPVLPAENPAQTTAVINPVTIPPPATTSTSGKCSFNSDCASNQVCACTGSVGNCSYQLGWCISSSTPSVGQLQVLSALQTGTSSLGVSINIGATSQLTVTPVDQFGGYYGAGNKTSAGYEVSPTINYLSSNSAVATVSSAGLITGVSGGNATITVTATVGSVNVSSTIPVAVTNTYSGLGTDCGITNYCPSPLICVNGFCAQKTSMIPTSGPILTNLSVSPTVLTLSVGGFESLSVTSLDQDGNLFYGAPATYYSSNPSVAMVSHYGVVKGISAGVATITITSQTTYKTIIKTVSATVR